MCLEVTASGVVVAVDSPGDLSTRPVNRRKAVVVAWVGCLGVTNWLLVGAGVEVIDGSDTGSSGGLDRENRAVVLNDRNGVTGSRAVDGNDGRQNGTVDLVLDLVQCAVAEFVVVSNGSSLGVGGIVRWANDGGAGHGLIRGNGSSNDTSLGVLGEACLDGLGLLVPPGALAGTRGVTVVRARSVLLLLLVVGGDEELDKCGEEEESTVNCQSGT